VLLGKTDCRARAGIIQPPKSAEEQVEPGDIVCGPRCVQFVLKYYGIEEDLIDLVREIQWPDLERGASLDSLEMALRMRGIETRAMRLGSRGVLKSPHPVIMHLNGKSAGGHYVVWLPSSSDSESHVWIGLAGVQVGPTLDLEKSRSGAILLTSPTPITRTDDAITGAFGLPAWVISLNAALLACSCVGWFVYRSRGKHMNRVSSL
jgi:ABC-type bacteriocin/lantibiotic exporter with double-glycine peptidase domain